MRKVNQNGNDSNTEITLFPHEQLQDLSAPLDDDDDNDDYNIRNLEIEPQLPSIPSRNYANDTEVVENYDMG